MSGAGSVSVSLCTEGRFGQRPSPCGGAGWEDRSGGQAETGGGIYELLARFGNHSSALLHVLRRLVVLGREMISGFGICRFDLIDALRLRSVGGSIFRKESFRSSCASRSL